jgi:cholesterol transport system auxiliary component
MTSCRLVPFVLILALLGGCSTLSALSSASASMDAFTLSPVPTSGTPLPGRRHLVVELPTSAGAVSSDRILVKPVPFQAEYLPDGRWSEPAPALIQTLLVASFQNTGGFRLVGRTGAGLMPDYTLMTELQDFHAEPQGAERAPLMVRVSVMATLIRESDRTIVGARRFAASATAPTNDTATLVRAFDAATRQVLDEVVSWTRAQGR